jgi:hypothetical protein
MTKPRFSRFNFEAWAKRQAIRKLGPDEDRKLAETIAAETLPGRPLEQKELVAWLLAKPTRLAQLRRQRNEDDDLDRVNYELRAVKMDTTPIAVRIAKNAVDNGASSVTEAELTQYIQNFALRDRRDGESSEACFTRVVCDNGAQGLMFRKALQIARGPSFPRV